MGWQVAFNLRIDEHCLVRFTIQAVPYILGILHPFFTLVIGLGS